MALFHHPVRLIPGILNAVDVVMPVPQTEGMLEEKMVGVRDIQHVVTRSGIHFHVGIGVGDDFEDRPEWIGCRRYAIGYEITMGFSPL